jgi:hypothetical protein
MIIPIFQTTPSISVVDPATLMANPLKRMADPSSDRYMSSPHSKSSSMGHAGSSHHHGGGGSGGSGGDKNQKGGKGTRPKRGKYRNYDRDSLIEAVRAVQRGEMSVHRAGSYYGVPHSTLEYKVKERHLMRPRKRDLNKPPAPPDSGDKAKMGGGGPRVQPPKPPTTPGGYPGGAGMPNLAAMAGLANGLGAKGMFGGPPPMAASASPYHQFWPGVGNPFMINPELYQEQLLASHMMQRANKAAAAAAAAAGPDAISDRFFDGLIRNSLERPAAATAADGLANRALLEQLCRGRPPPAATVATDQAVVDLSQDDERPAASGDSDAEAAPAALDDCDTRDDEEGTSVRNSTD